MVAAEGAVLAMAGIPISEFIERLEAVQTEHGDLEVVVDRDGVRVPFSDHESLHLELKGEGYTEERDQVII